MKECIEPELLDIPCSQHALGNLYFAQADLPLPFELRRAYYVFGIPDDARRGGHAHYKGTELLVALQGSLTLRLLNPQGKEVIFKLNHPGTGAIIPSGWWVDLRGYSQNAITLALSSVEFFEDNYVRKPEQFFEGAIPSGVISRCKR